MQTISCRLCNILHENVSGQSRGQFYAMPLAACGEGTEAFQRDKNAVEGSSGGRCGGPVLESSQHCNQRLPLVLVNAVIQVSTQTDDKTASRMKRSEKVNAHGSYMTNPMPS